MRDAVKCDLIADVARRFGEVRLKVTGTSMLPSLWPGDILTVRRQGTVEILPGEVVMFARQGHLVAHRVVRKIIWQDRTLLVTRGDRLRKPDPPVYAEELLGRVTAIERHRGRRPRRIVPRLTVWASMASWVLCRSEFCTQLLLRLRGWVLGAGD